MDANQTAHEIAKRGGRIESRYGNEIVVSSGSMNNLLHFLMGFPTLGLWWVLVWLPKSAWGGEKRRVVYSNTPGEPDLRLPNEIPWPAFTIISSLVIGTVIIASTAHGELVALVAVIGWACLLRAIGNRPA